jgi:hypothetical protein
VCQCQCAMSMPECHLSECQQQCQWFVWLFVPRTIQISELCERTRRRARRGRVRGCCRLFASTASDAAREGERETSSILCNPNRENKSKNLPTRGIPGRFLSLVLIPPNRA